MSFKWGAMGGAGRVPGFGLRVSTLVGIRARLFLLVLVAILPILAFLALTVKRLADHDRQRAQETALEVARQVSIQVDAHLRHVETLLYAVAAGVSSDLGNIAANDAMLRTLQARLPSFSPPPSELANDLAYGIVAIRTRRERERAEAALWESEERLRLALAAANQGLYDLNVQTGEAVVTLEYATMLGYDPATFHETNAQWIERLHPDDREPIAETYRSYIRGDIPEYRVEFRQRTATGDYKQATTSGSSPLGRSPSGAQRDGRSGCWAPTPTSPPGSAWRPRGQRNRGHHGRFQKDDGAAKIICDFPICDWGTKAFAISDLRFAIGRARRARGSWCSNRKSEI